MLLRFVGVFSICVSCFLTAGACAESPDRRKEDEVGPTRVSAALLKGYKVLASAVRNYPENRSCFSLLWLRYLVRSSEHMFSFGNGGMGMGMGRTHVKESDLEDSDLEDSELPGSSFFGERGRPRPLNPSRTRANRINLKRERYLPN